MTQKLVSALAVAACLLAALPAAAQSGAVTGQVVDQDGAPFPFADVFLEAMEGSFQDVTLADDEGRFRFSPVPVGDYKLYAYAQGFTSTRFTNIDVTPNRTLRYEVRLAPAEEFTEDVEVNAQVQDLVDTKRTDTSTTISGQFIEAIPLQNKRIQDIVALFAGVTRNGSSDSADISVAGGTSGQVGYRLNGLSINDPVDGGAILDISTGAIQDFKLITGGFQAKYGEQSTGIAEIITKSGDNEISFQYEVSFRDTEYGSSAIDELDDVAEFWHETFTGEGTTLDNEIEAGFRLLGIDPVSTRADDHNPPERHRVRHTISTGGPIVRDKVFFHATLEALADDSGSAFVDGTTYTDQLLFTGKIDWQVNPDNKLEISTNLDTSEGTGFAALGVERSAQREQSRGTWNVAVDDTHVFNDTTFLESRLQVLQDYNAVRPTNKRAGVGTQFGIYLPPGGVFTYTAGDAFADFDQTITNIRVEESLSKTFGAADQHDFEVGVTWQSTNFESFVEQGAFVQDFRIADDRNVLGGQAMFIGNERTFGPPRITDETTWAAALYLQDQWRVTDNLTLDLGLRGDYQDFVGELFIAPRFGFSLDPIGDGTTRFFGNWGLFYDNLFTSALQHAGRPDRLWADLDFEPGFMERDFSQTSVAEAYKDALASPRNRPSGEQGAIAFLTNTFEDRFVLDDELTAPTNKAWTVGIERRLPANMRLQLSYSEAKRTHQIVIRTETVRLPVELGDRTLRDIIYGTTGEGRYRQWAVELQKPFSSNWQMNMSYTQSKNTGPVPPPDNPATPLDTQTVNGLLGNDRTHVFKVQARGQLPWKLDLSGDFTWQTGRPETATIITSSGQTVRPFGRNTLRTPSARQLNVGLKRPFQTADGKLQFVGEIKFFNVLNELNVFNGIGRFEVPFGSADPLRFPPLRPTVIPTGIDVPRSMELGLTISF